MKKSILVSTLAILVLAGFGTPAQAQDEYQNQERYRDNRDERDNRDNRNDRNNRDSDYRQLRAELYRLDSLFSRVESRLRYDRGGRGRWQYSRLLRERERLNYELQRRPLDRFRIHSQIDRIRDQLREVEVRLRYRSDRSYR
jgi:TolA-binding protein